LPLSDERADPVVTAICPAITLSPHDYDLVLFDLDVVVAQTAELHAAAWKRLFDAVLEQRSADLGDPFLPFDIEADYRRYVEGRSGRDGTAAFLRSREIDLPWGAPEDDADVNTIQALSDHKDGYFLQCLQQRGAKADETTIALVRALREQQIRTGVVSCSNNCSVVLEAAGIGQLFDICVDGADITLLELTGKPAPDAFCAAARRLGVEPDRAVFVADAIAGVEVGRSGQFGCIIGLDRRGQSQALREAGADVVVASPAQIRVTAEPPSAWSLVFDGFDPPREGIREALCTLGNGYFATRAAATWAVADGTHYPATYLAGGYNRLRTDIGGRAVEGEALVNFPNWVGIGFRIGNEDWFDAKATTLLSYRQELDLRRGLLLRTIRFEDGQGRRSVLQERRLVSMADMHLGALELTLTAENWSGSVTIRSAIDGRVVNSGAKLYAKFSGQHLVPLTAEIVGEDSIYLLVRTCQSDIRVAQVARTRAFLNGQHVATRREAIDEPGYIGQLLTIDLAQDQTLVVEKLACLYTSRDNAISECGLAARKAIARAGGFQSVKADHVQAWTRLWRRFGIAVEPADPEFKLNVAMLLRLNMFHLLQTVSLHSLGLDIGVPARGWTGEAYQGHIFWDELFIFPFFNYRVPEITRALLLYRYRRLGEARAAAQAAGHKGAMFPWQSGSDGREETEKFNLNPRSQRWVPDNSYLQRHVGSAVAYNVWQYFQVTRDLEFLRFYGAELILEIALFWSSMAVFNAERGRYEIRGVMGPDEFHDGYPDAATPGVNNNAYTNVMAVWVLCRAIEALDLLSAMRRGDLTTRLGISPDEIARWDHISRRMFVPFHKDGVISQFEGYDALRELDWDAYRMRYGNIQRLDLILEAESDSPNRYKLSKQADVLMLFYLFSSEELEELFRRLDYPFDYHTIPKSVGHYAARTSHGSTLCRVVHAWVLARSDRPRAMTFFAEALQSDVSDIQQGTASEGVHLGAMAGTVDLIQRVSTGIEVKGDVLRLNPELPLEMESLDMRIRYRGHSIDLQLSRECLTVRGHDRQAPPISLSVAGKTCEFVAGSTQVFPLDRV
jgi:HAD superfamily hydrolase (TIGR01509 family)